MQDLKAKLEAAYKSITWHDCELCHEQYTAPGWHCTACGHHSESWCATCRRCSGPRRGMPRIVKPVGKVITQEYKDEEIPF